MAAHGVSIGTMTPGDFVMIQALFMQLAGPLFNMGTFFREVDQSQVDVEDLFHMLRQQPHITEKPDAKPFEYQAGKIEFRDLGFRHYIVKDHKKE
jgi:ABC-type transport system involved in Fe-S cluster assembly fused permease/ATPase subunit